VQEQDNKIKVINYDATLSSLKENSVLSLFILAEFKNRNSLLLNPLIKLNSSIFILRLVSYQIIISSCTMLSKFPLFLLTLIELTYLGYNVSTYSKQKHLKTPVLLIGKVIQSVFLTTFLVICIRLAEYNPYMVRVVSSGLQSSGKTVIFIAIILESILAIIQIVMKVVDLLKDRKYSKNQSKLVKMNKGVIKYKLVDKRELFSGEV